MSDLIICGCVAFFGTLILAAMASVFYRGEDDDDEEENLTEFPEYDDKSNSGLLEED